MEAPGREIHVLDLTGERAGAAAANEAIDTGDAGELLDDEARRSYQRRLEDLEETVAEAESFGDAARAARAQARRSRCWARSSAGRSGWGAGRAGRAGRRNGRAARSSAASRTPSSASASTTRPSGALLTRTVRTGNYCVYRPA